MSFFKWASFIALPSKGENGGSDVIPGLCLHRFGYSLFSASSTLLKERLLNSIVIITYIDSVVQWY